MPKHVLIAEDDVSLAEMMGKILRRYSVRVTIASNGLEALQVMEEDVPDLLLLDLLMPALDGHGVMQAMQEKKIDCPVIVISNLSDNMTKEKCKKLQVKHFFVKNEMDDDDLWPAIEKYLR